MRIGVLKILTVCTANVCRSPLAELALTKKLEAERATVSSVGVEAFPGARIDPTIMAIARDRGLGDLDGHRSRLFVPSYFAKFDLILCMEQVHIARVLRGNMAQHGKVKLLGHWQRVEISDPTGMKLAQYKQCFELIDFAATSWAEKLRKMELV